MFKGFRRLMVRTVALALVVTAGWGGLKAIQKNNAEGGEVAGVSTASPTSTETTDNPKEKYKESFASIPFDQTEWETYTDFEFGFSIRWPKNASNRVKTTGGSNIWFLRYDSYLAKVSYENTNDLLDAWWVKNSGFYTTEATAVKGALANRTAWIITPNEPGKNSGKTYIVQGKNGIIQLWIKDEEPLSDDGQRVAGMLNSFSVTN